MLDKQTLKMLHHKDQFKDEPQRQYWILGWLPAREFDRRGTACRLQSLGLVFGLRCVCASVQVCRCVCECFLAKTNMLALQSVLRSAINSLTSGEFGP